MSGHTPRPWRVGSLVSFNGQTGEPEAFVYRLGPDDDRESAHNRICVRGAEGAMDCDADAALIAAAPDLLTAALEVVASTKGTDGLEMAPTRASVEHLEAAIAKAEGRS